MVDDGWGWQAKEALGDSMRVFAWPGRDGDEAE